MTDGKIPVTAAKRVAVEHGLKQVLLIGYDGAMSHVVTYGETPEDCKKAAQAQEFWVGRIREFSFTEMVEPDSLIAIIDDLEKRAAENEDIAKNGSMGTSMREDAQLGAVGREQRRIIALLKALRRP